MSPGSHTPSSRAWLSRWARPPQSMHTMICSGSSTPPSVPAVRVVAGEHRGRRLVAPDGTSTRPTGDRVREAVFNSLGHLDLVVGARYADLFAGTGALGIEALSRGASHCTFVERDQRALRALRTNLDNLGLAARASVVPGDAIALGARLDRVDVVLADPPYDFEAWSELLAALTCDFVVVERGRPLGEVGEGWDRTREKRYGRTYVTFLQRAEQVP
jgi:16S rRNA (guanine966-N2)-methyltransferase